MNKQILLADIKVDILDSHQIEQRISELIYSNSKVWISYVNAHALNLAQEYDWFKDYLNKSEISYADGQGIRFAAWLLRKPIPPLVNLTRWSWSLFKFCEENKFSIYLLGAKENVIQKAVENLSKKYPKLNISGYHNGYFEKTREESKRICELISQKKPNILIVGMGMPLQEQWIKENIDNLNVNVIMNAGSCLDIIAGTKKVCPKWMSDIGLEWAFRLSQEPKRLFKRYILGNPKFVYYILTKK